MKGLKKAGKKKRGDHEEALGMEEKRLSLLFGGGTAAMKNGVKGGKGEFPQYPSSERCGKRLSKVCHKGHTIERRGKNLPSSVNCDGCHLNYSARSSISGKGKGRKEQLR